MFFFFFFFFGINNLDNVFWDRKSYKNILIDHVSCKTMIDAKLECIRFDKIDRFFRSYNGTKMEVKYDVIYNRITWLINQESSIKFELDTNKQK